MLLQIYYILEKQKKQKLALYGWINSIKNEDNK